ncbi:cupin domain-containing protein [Alpinimonas psychrophila]|uniref:(S)-ureidoglycine aminohydrolase cupin domain-containing protein n=1 Tax=Alpinimonas psychrophila TaxID=748908 RepID=A0A7W3JV57_9MICO|nr:cupin domain-containing protein [Alpinimonas psychrophila]MBA8829856.1 hypothetical protein [Alpinimonas psychrophila]
MFPETFMADAASLTLSNTPVPAAQVVAGSPFTGSAVLGDWGGKELGVWQMTPGEMTDVEADELCVILSGSGMVHRQIGGETVQQPLVPGAVFALLDGEETLWVVTETVRKVYLA